MRSRLFLGAQYFYYWLNAVDSHSLQAPFVFKFYNEVILPDRSSYAFKEIECLRRQLLRDPRKITVEDFGAGSTVNGKKQRKVADIAKHSLSNLKFSNFLHKAILFTRPENIIELGTSLGINTLYMAKTSPSIPIITLEGCTQTIKIAEDHFNTFQAENIKIKKGNIDITLPHILNTLEFVDFVYFDANHTKEATLRYFGLCLKKARPQTIFIFDDIHLSQEMSDAWKMIRENPAVSLSMDIFDAGVIFFEKGLTKHHYILAF